MNQDTELEMWRHDWEAPDRDESAVDHLSEPVWAEQIRVRVARQSRRLWIGLLAPILVTGVVGGCLAVQALRVGRFLDYAVAVEGWLFIIVLWAGCLQLARGIWKPLGQSTASFVDLAIRRCRSNLAIARLSLWMYAGQLILGAGIGWIESRSLRPYLTSGPMVVMGWIGLPLFVAWLVWYRRRESAELGRLLELKGQLSDHDVPPQ